MTKTPETSAYTSIKARPKKPKQLIRLTTPINKKAASCLLWATHVNMPQGLPFKLTDYLEQVELNGPYAKLSNFDVLYIDSVISALI